MLGALGAKLAIVAIGLILMLVCVQMFLSQMQKTVVSLSRQNVQAVQPAASHPRPTLSQPAAASLQRSSTLTLPSPAQQAAVKPQASIGTTMSKAELEAWQRKNAESMRILESTTPEL
jgi:hypothetical protein